VPEQGLNDPDIGTVLQQVSGEGVAQHVGADPFSEPAALPGLTASGLHGAGADMILVVPGRGKQPRAGRTQDAEVGAEEGQQGGRQHGVTVLGALGVFEAQEHALAVDVADFERHRFGDAEPGTIAGQQDGALFEPVQVVEEMLHLLGGENDGKLFFYAGAREVLLFPGHLQGDQEEKLDSGDEGADALGGEFPFLAQVELILADGLQVQTLGAEVEVFGELGDIMDIAALGGGREVADAHVFDHALA
jgi:hypothetical protein